MSKKIQFRLRELMAERERITGENTTYQTIHGETGISPNTLSTMANNKMTRIGLSVIERLLDYFDCGIADLVVTVDE